MAIEKASSFICYGINSAISIIKSNRFKIKSIDIMYGSNAQKNKILKNIIDYSLVTVLEKKEFFNQYSEKKTQGIVIKFFGQITEKNFPDYSNESKVCLLVLDRLEDPQNFGQIIRTAECAGVNGIIFPKHHSAPINNTVLQVSQGAFVNTALYEMTNLSQTINQLKKDNFWVIGLENGLKANPWHEMDYTNKVVIVIGSEGKGIRRKVLDSCDFISTIPMQGEINSLNVGAAVSAVAFERLRQIMENDNGVNT